MEVVGTYVGFNQDQEENELFNWLNSLLHPKSCTSG